MPSTPTIPVEEFIPANFTGIHSRVMRQKYNLPDKPGLLWILGFEEAHNEINAGLNQVIKTGLEDIGFPIGVQNLYQFIEFLLLSTDAYYKSPNYPSGAVDSLLTETSLWRFTNPDQRRFAHGKLEQRHLDYFFPTTDTRKCLGFMADLIDQDRDIRSKAQQMPVSPFITSFLSRINTSYNDSGWSNALDTLEFVEPFTVRNQESARELAGKIGMANSSDIVEHAGIEGRSLESIVDLKNWVEEFEDNFIPQLQTAARFAEGAIFDYRNLLVDRYTTSSIRNLLLQGINIEISLYFGMPANGILNMAKNSQLQKALKREKIIAMEQAANRASSRANLFGALITYTLNLANSIIHRLNAGNALFLNYIKNLEFGDFTIQEKFHDYMRLLRSQQDLGSLLTPIIFRLQEEQVDPITAPAYLNLFTSPENRQAEKKRALTSTNAVDIWLAAYKNGWGDVLAKSISLATDILEDEKASKDLQNQENGSLMLLMRNQLFKGLYQRGVCEGYDYAMLSNFLEVNKTLFDYIFPHCTPKDSPFIQGMMRLFGQTTGDYRFQVNEEIKALVSSLPIGVDGAHTLEFLNNYELAKNAITFGLIPSEEGPEPLENPQSRRILNKQPIILKSIEEVEDVPALIKYFHTHLKELSSKVSDVRKISQFLKSYNDPELTQKIVDIQKKKGTGFLTQYLPAFEALGPVGYERMVDLAATVASSARWLNRRDVSSSLEYIAMAADEANWKTLKRLLQNSTGTGDKEKGDRIKEMADQFGFSTGQKKEEYEDALKRAYDRELLTSNKGLADRLHRQVVSGKLPKKVGTMIGMLIAGGNFKLGTLLVGQAELGLPRKEMEDLLDLYLQDSDLGDVNPSAVVNLMRPKENKREQRAPHQYSFSGLYSHLARQGYNGDDVRAVIEKGLKGGTSSGFVGGNYLPQNFVEKNSRNAATDPGRMIDEFSQLIKFLVGERILLRHNSKGRKKTGGCLSINPHIQDITSEPLRDYLRHLLYERQ